MASLTEVVRVECLWLQRSPVVHLRIFVLGIVCGVRGTEWAGRGVRHVGHGGEGIGGGQRFLRANHSS